MRDIRHRTGRCLSFLLVILAFPLAPAAPARGAAMNSGGPLPESGRELYRTACMACHGPDGAGSGRDRVGFDLPLPDFTDCNFAPREANTDWTAVVAEGGPAPGFFRDDARLRRRAERCADREGPELHAGVLR